VQQHGGEQAAPPPVLQIDGCEGHGGAHVRQLALEEKQHGHRQGDQHHRDRGVEQSFGLWPF